MDGQPAGDDENPRSEWIAGRTAFQRVYDYLVGTREFSSARTFAEGVDCSDAGARSALEQLVEMGIAERRDGRPASDRRNESYVRWKRVEELAREHTAEELRRTVEELIEDDEHLQERYGVPDPGSLPPTTVEDVDHDAVHDRWKDVTDGERSGATSSYSSGRHTGQRATTRAISSPRRCLASRMGDSIRSRSICSPVEHVRTGSSPTPRTDRRHSHPAGWNSISRPTAIRDRVPEPDSTSAGSIRATTPSTTRKRRAAESRTSVDGIGIRRPTLLDSTSLHRQMRVHPWRHPSGPTIR